MDPEDESRKKVDTMSKENSDVYNCLQSQEFNDAERHLLKGDTVGDTVYSAKWILNALISLSKVSEEVWSKSLENDLCMLWDMTTDKDVVEFLLENEFFKVADFSLRSSQEPRLTEIVIGIITNMCCQEAALSRLIDAEEELVHFVLGHLSTADTETLIQILRLLKSAIWNIQSNANSRWKATLENCQFLGNALIFILQSSTNKQLLVSTLELLDSLSSVFLPNNKNLFTSWFDVNQLVPALVESFTQLNIFENQDCSEVEIKTINNWLVVLSNMIQNEIMDFEMDCNRVIIDILEKVLQPYENLGNIMSLEEESALCIENSIEIIMWFYRKSASINLDVFRTIVMILINFHLVVEQNREEESKLEEEMQRDFPKPENGLLEYLNKWWLTMLGSLQKEQMLDMLGPCENHRKSSLMKLTQSKGKDVSNDDLQKLIEALSISSIE